MRHTILGAGGSIGNALAVELLKTNGQVRLVSRRNYSLPGTESFRADLTSYEETLQSVKNSDVVYLCAGLTYDSKIWAEQWPGIMSNTINACKSVNAKLVFFDNVYMYGKVKGKMTETTPYNPCSKKGEIRTLITLHLEDEIYKKNINAIIARSADLYGPYASKTSLPYILVIDKLMKKKRAQWMIDADTLHSFTYTIDAAKGMVLLSNTEECYNQVWHLPTSNPLNAETIIHMIAKELNTTPDYDILNKWMIKVGGIFDKTVSELYEMLYQNEFNYYFDSSKFNQFFNYKPKSYYEGIHETVEFFRKQSIVNNQPVQLGYYSENELIKSHSV
jgi:nucleoside-diphosphate-sugar epimerase